MPGQSSAMEALLLLHGQQRKQPAARRARRAWHTTPFLLLSIPQLLPGGGCSGWCMLKEGEGPSSSAPAPWPATQHLGWALVVPVPVLAARRHTGLPTPTSALSVLGASTGGGAGEGGQGVHGGGAAARSTAGGDANEHMGWLGPGSS
jgi:hypothetical protein